MSGNAAAHEYQWRRRLF